jgi:hypothetical protein
VSGHSVRDVADAIARFLAAQPACADTIEGIQQWWLRPSGIDSPRDVIASALELLEMEQHIERRQVGTREIWRLRRSP